MSWTSNSSLQGQALTRGYTWAQSTTLAPILPPNMPRASMGVGEAMKAPPVARGLGLYSAAMLAAKWEASAATLRWLNAASGPIPPALRNVRTMTDLIMVNRALWITSGDGVQRGEAVHLHAHLWSVNENGVIALGGHEPNALGEYVIGGQVITRRDNLVFFPGAMPLGFLDAAQDTLTNYMDVAATIRSRGRTPMPVMELKVTDTYDGPLPGDPDYVEDEDPILQAQASYAAARRMPDGAVTITPQGVELIAHQVDDDGAMLIDARNALRIDVALHMNLPGSMLDGHSGGSADYSNTLQKRNEFEDLSVSLFTAPILHRLSMDDVTPAGELVTLRTLDSLDASGNIGTAVGTLQAGPSPGEHKNA
jgi:hypothetical protein